MKSYSLFFLFLWISYSLLLSIAPAFSTTIAWDGHHIAADSQCTLGHHKLLATKIFRSEARKATMAGAGDASLLKIISDFFTSTDEPFTKLDLKIDADKTPVTLLIVYDTGGALFYGGDLEAVSIVEAPFTMGTGGDIALGAMTAGKSAEEAVKIATKIDLFTSGPVLVMEAPVVQKPVEHTELVGPGLELIIKP